MRFDGRGRWYRWNTKPTVDEYASLDVGKVARDVGLERAVWSTCRWRWGSGRESSIVLEVQPGRGVRLHYKAGGQDVPPYVVPVVYTTPHYGGRRPWFVCPHCRQRVRFLYGGRLFLCRECHGLTYAIRNQRGADAVVTAVRNRKERVATRLGAGRDDPYPTKPRGMHWATYLRLLSEYRDLGEVESLSFYASILEIVEGREVPSELSPRRLWRSAKVARPSIDPLPRRIRTWLTRRPRPSPEPVPLAELAQLAGVPYVFAREATRARLLRSDVGRGTKKPRYRPRLASWLGKLWQLRGAGMSWVAIRAWSKRRWASGHEYERAWPEGYGPTGPRGSLSESRGSNVGVCAGTNVP